MFRTREIDVAAFLASPRTPTVEIWKTEHPKIREFVFEQAAFETLQLFYREDKTMELRKYLAKRAPLKFMPLIE
jgi:hypothetical protein